jgi:hypothetical protein
MAVQEQSGFLPARKIALRCQRMIYRVAAALLLAVAAVGAAVDAAHCAEPAIIQKIIDEREIERLIIEYSWLLDARDFEKYGALFENGAILNPAGKVVATGAAQVAALGRHYLGGQTDIFVRHLVSNIRIDVAADGMSATAGSFLTTIEAPAGKPAYVFRVARYNDRFHKVDGHWRFLNRQENTDWVLRERQPPLPAEPQ